MMQAGFRVIAVACLTAIIPLAAAAGDGQGNNIQVEKPATVPEKSEKGYRPAWADPNAKPPQPGIENDPTPFNPSDMNANTDTLNMKNLKQ